MSRRQKEPGDLGKVTPRKLKSGRWQARVEIRDGTGKLIPLSATGDNSAAAILAIAEKANAVWSGAFIEVTADTKVEALGTIWMNQLIKAKKQAPSTIQQYQATLRTLIYPRIRAYRVGALTPAFCDAFLRELAAESPSKGKKARNALTQMLRIAVLHGVFSHNPVMEVDRMPGVKSVKVSYDEEQVLVVMNLLKEYQGANPTRRGGGRPDTQLVEDVFRIALGTSARPGEVLALREEDIVFGETTTVSINATIVRVKGEFVTGEEGAPEDKLYRKPTPKHSRQIRTVHVADFAVEPLRRLVANYRDNKYKLLFTTSKNNPKDPNNVARTIRKFREHYAEELAVMEINGMTLTMKSFRKTAATVVSRELGTQDAQDLLGHSSPQITEDFYVKRAPTVNKETASVLSQKFAALN